MPLADYADHDALALAELVRKREVSASELLEAAIEHIERSNPELNAVIDRLYDRARQAIARGLPKGPFTGVPFLMKDTLELAGTRASFGSVAGLIYRCPTTHELVRRHEAAGLVILGRTNMAECGLLPTTENRAHGSTKNPHHLAYSTGGSSGGAAAAVAARMVPLAHADDGGGSIRIPASACGVFGLKPSRGRNPAGPREPPLDLIQSHAVSRSVRDSAALLDATWGPAASDEARLPPPPCSYLEAVHSDPEPLRIAFMTRDFAGNPAHPDCAEAVHETAKRLAELGHRVEEADPAIDGAAYNDAFLMIWAMMGGYFVKAAARAATERFLPPRLSRWLGDRVLAPALKGLSALPIDQAPFEPFTCRLATIDRKHSPSDLWLAADTMRRAAHQLGNFLIEYDVLLTPVMGEPPWKLGTLCQRWPDRKIRAKLERYVGYTPICNTAGLPAMSVPLHTSQQGLPIGLHFVAPFAEEHRLFALAGQLERAHPWRMANLKPPSSRPLNTPHR